VPPRWPMLLPRLVRVQPDSSGDGRAGEGGALMGAIDLLPAGGRQWAARRASNRPSQWPQDALTSPSGGMQHPPTALRASLARWWSVSAESMDAKKEKDVIERDLYDPKFATSEVQLDLDAWGSAASRSAFAMRLTHCTSALLRPSQVAAFLRTIVDETEFVDIELQVIGGLQEGPIVRRLAC
jgi:hypothetical protein